MPYISQTDQVILDRAKAQQSGGGGFQQWVPLIIAMLCLPSLRDEDTSLGAADTALTALQATGSGNVYSNVDAIKLSVKDVFAKRKIVNRAEKLSLLIGGIFAAFANGNLGGMSGGGGGVVLIVLIFLLLSNTSGSLLGGII